MPVRLDEPRHYDWAVPRAEAGAQKYYQDLYQKTPFLILDASIAASDYGETALFLCVPSDSEGNIKGDPFVMALGANGRDRYIEQAQAVADEHHHADGIGPLIIEMVETDKGNPFPAFRKFTGTVAGSKAAARTTAQTKKSKVQTSTDEIPF